MNLRFGKVKPRLSDAASDKLLELYVAMRKRGGEGAGGVRTVSATPRNLESLVRMSEARAKLELREVVEVSDVDEAHRLMVSAIAQVATDPTTGLLDIDLLNAGQSAHQRGKARDLANILWTTLSNWESGEHANTMKYCGGATEQYCVSHCFALSRR